MTVAESKITVKSLTTATVSPKLKSDLFFNKSELVLTCQI